MLVPFLIAVFVVLIVFKPKETEDDGSVVVKKKQCPPHAWYGQEIKDQDGNVVGERIVCRNCGPWQP